MHGSSMDRMREFVESLGPANGRNVLDVGAMNICGDYRPLFEPKGFIYQGLDQAAGANVDLVEASFPWSIPDNFYDIVISGQALEHVEQPTLFMLQLTKVLKPGGAMCVIVPHAWHYHACPIDCWRIFSDGMNVLLRDVGLEVVKVSMTPADTPTYGDTVAWAGKAENWNCNTVVQNLISRYQAML